MSYHITSYYRPAVPAYLAPDFDAPVPGWGGNVWHAGPERIGVGATREVSTKKAFTWKPGDPCPFKPEVCAALIKTEAANKAKKAACVDAGGTFTWATKTCEMPEEAGLSWWIRFVGACVLAGGGILLAKQKGWV